MKQIFQNLSTGETEIVDAPAPQARRNSLLIDTTVSLISTGTERMLVDFGKSGLVAKVRSQPEKVRQVIDKVTTDGLITTVDAVRSKLGQPIPLGYCNVGKVIAVGQGVTDFKVGDRVASNGQHAEFLKKVNTRIPLGRMANDTEYQGTLLWMLSSASNYLNGAIVPVDGGRSAW